MTTVPSVKTLRYLTGEREGSAPIANRVRKALLGFDMYAHETWAEARATEDALNGAALALQSSEVPDRWRFGNGVESLVIGQDYVYYLNTGESYQPTLLYDRRFDRFMVTSWGDYAELRERNRDSRFREG